MSKAAKHGLGWATLRRRIYGTPQDEVPGRSLKNRVIPRFPCIASGSSFHVQAKKKQNGALAGCVLASHFGLQQFIGLIVHWLRRM